MILYSWGDGSNHVLFNMLPGIAPEYNTTLDVARGRAIIAGGGFNTWSYRYTYDVAVPVFNPWTDGLQLPFPDKYVVLLLTCICLRISCHSSNSDVTGSSWVINWLCSVSVINLCALSGVCHTCFGAPLHLRFLDVYCRFWVISSDGSMASTLYFSLVERYSSLRWDALSTFTSLRTT